MNLEALDLDGEDATNFHNVLSKLNFERLPSFASSVRSSGHHSMSITASTNTSPSLEVEILPKVDCGYFHAVITISFTDGRLWVLKVPRKGYAGSWNRRFAQALVSEAQTMRLLRRETSIPLPEVYAFDSAVENELGCPFILMEKIPGKSMFYGWYDDESSKTKGQ